MSDKKEIRNKKFEEYESMLKELELLAKSVTYQRKFEVMKTLHESEADKLR